MLKPKARWSVTGADAAKAERLAESLNITLLVASLLVNRGIEEPEAAKAFLYMDQQDFHDPFLMNGMDSAVARIKKAVDSHEKICVYGDYDADGVTSTVVMLETLHQIGADADFYIPNRFTEGYGPNKAAFLKLKETGVSLIITVDTGISAAEEADYAKEIGLDLIITDHHEAGPVLPDAISIVHPKLPGSLYPFKELAGVGVALKVSHALLGTVQDSLLELAAIGTIADLVSLHGENRLIASRGIERLKRTGRPGIKALLQQASSKEGELTEETIGFAIAPRINAVGRLQSADPAVECLRTADSARAAELAADIDSLNRERQKIVQDIAREAIEMTESLYPPEEYPVLVLANSGWNPGVVGIVASKIVEKFYRPTIILCLDEEGVKAKGSARSIPGFDLFKNLSECRELLPHFGGHPMAAGMTLAADDIDELRERMNALAKNQLKEEDFVPLTKVDLSCRLDEVTLSSIEEMNLLAPFGMHNPKPVVMIEDLSVSGMRKIGSNQNHLKLTLEQDETQLDCVGFGFGHLHDEISPVSKVSVVGQLSVNEWNNFRKPQFMLQDAAVKGWQLFDHRGTRQVKQILERIPSEKKRLIAFKKETAEQLMQQGISGECLYIESPEQASQTNLQGRYAVFMDVPDNMDIFASLFNQAEPERIYVFFHQTEDHFFSTIPTREHFKWFYGFLLKREQFDINRHGAELAKHKGWTSDTIDFMSKVFFELDFVTINNGLISINKNGGKRDLSESLAYKQKKDQMELENRLLYSSYRELLDWFDEQLNKASKPVQV
ncbi:single-stranded-DNA-specific exonuclease RecJ [Bacillus sp. FJAT-42376]|uniref:single-stranded-DNA-specific exonuclease RecJ n=1 Tax=Bacillus sp. FJAT-42376 TaxID=2014076 RepID=UPI000F4FF204|nr:single-stranded-DNA-specific exonuclease RecJ [Bacillus sp. FJAT-42376]AZB43742.1 single-stranded-DNA-specific exonuclease RecJ [Bacillus sp. FJAT-42376]